MLLRGYSICDKTTETIAEFTVIIGAVKIQPHYTFMINGLKN